MEDIPFQTHELKITEVKIAKKKAKA